MGCANSTTTATVVRRLTTDQTDTGSKHGDREDSAVSKGTTDSGVVVENRDVLVLPGDIPGILPPLSSGSFTTGYTEEVTKETDAPVVPQQDEPVKQRQKSSEILEELMSEGIIPAGQSKETLSGTSYSLTMEDEGVVTRRPPARLKSLKVKKAQTFHSREEIDEKMRLAEVRRKSNEETLKTRLRTMSARVRVPAPRSNPSSDEDTSLIPVQSLPSPELSQSPEQLSQDPHGSPQEAELVEETSDDGEELKKQMQVIAKSSEEEEEEEATRVEEFKDGELEVDSSFQQTKDKDDSF
ncbi:stathmin domain-containing protein 1 [Oryzias melastigma]|uniref:stathmin domain-containing protein 1 n=1 Tax=Oryzias melastigma TaxID=30732 RepID=UPI000CF8370C|nr:stathmin domain-containing protein 1 [Oryzias melastigma]